MQSQQSQSTNPNSAFAPSGGSSFADQPPQYDSVNAPTTSAGNQPDIFEENQYGEMRPAESNVVRDPSAQGPVQDDFAENQYGEIHRSGTDPERLPPNTSSSSQNFGRDTPERSKEFRSGETYAENRYGELGRADTYVDDQVHMSDKVKGTAEQIIGKLTGNKELHDKGVSRKSPPR